MIPHKFSDKKNPDDCTVCGALRTPSGKMFIPRVPAGEGSIQCSEDCDEARREIDDYHINGRTPSFKTMQWRRAFSARRETVSITHDEGLLKKLDGQFSKVRDEAFDEAMAVLKLMKGSPADKYDNNTLGCAIAILDSVKAGEYIGPCITPTGRMDGHMAYVRRNDKGKMVCMFCGKDK